MIAVPTNDQFLDLCRQNRDVAQLRRALAAVLPPASLPRHVDQVMALKDLWLAQATGRSRLFNLIGPGDRGRRVATTGLCDRTHRCAPAAAAGAR
jgi:hypothetical protein